jgi:parallel beta-helix repeat protein
MTSYTLSPVWGAGAQLFDNSGNVLTGGKIETYEAGTTTNAATYTDPIGSTFNSNPIIADASGRLSNEIWLSVGASYKFVLKDANNVLIATYDNIPASPQPPIVNDASSISYEQGYTVTAGAFTVGATYLITSVGSTNFVAIGAAANVTGILFTATGVGSGNGTAEYSRTVQARLRDVASAKDFGAVGDGVVDDAPAIQAAVNAANTVFVPAGTYRLGSSIVLKTNSSIRGVGRKDFQGAVGGTAFAPNSGVTSFITTAEAAPTTAVTNIYLYGFGIFNNFTGTNYDIQLANASSCTIENVIVVSGNQTVTDCAGIYFTRKPAYSGVMFVNKVVNCRLNNASVKYESTDNYLIDSEVWGSPYRSFAVHLVRSSNLIDNCQISGGRTFGGVYVEDTIDGFGVELVKISNTFFDGSYDNIDSGMGIYGVQMIRSTITGCSFWRQRKEGIYLEDGQNIVIVGNSFINNNREDNFKDDIYMDNCQASIATGNSFTRPVTHVNKGKAINTVNSPSFPNVFIGSSVFFASNYAASTFSNLDMSTQSTGIALAGKTNVQASVTTTFAGTVSAETILTFGTEITDNLDEFDGTSFFAKAAGFYTVSYTIAYTAILSGTRIISRVLLNNATYATLYDRKLSASGDTVTSGSISLFLNAGDKININYFQDGVGDIVQGATRTRLNIMRVD